MKLEIRNKDQKTYISCETLIIFDDNDKPIGVVSQLGPTTFTASWIGDPDFEKSLKAANLNVTLDNVEVLKLNKLYKSWLSKQPPVSL